MSELATLARPYASAVFKRAKETGSTKKWTQQLAFLSAVLNHADIAVIVDNPKISKKDLSELMVSICQEKINLEAENFLKLLIHNNRLNLIATIAQLFEAYKAEDEGYIDVEVATAYSFSKDAKQRFTATLEKTLGKKVNMNVTVDSSLIGGVLVRAGDRVIDGSIRGQLQQLAKRL